MKGWVARSVMTSDLGSGPAWIAVTFSVQATFAPVVYVLLWDLWLVPSIAPTVRLDLWLLAGLGAAFTIWIGLVALRRLPGWTGAGLVLAGYGLTGRAWADFALVWFEVRRMPLESEIEATRTIGLAAYGAGLALCAVSTVIELRVRARPVPLGLGKGEWKPSETSVFR